MGEGMEHKHYHMVRKNQANLRGLFRGVVTAALLYIAYRLPAMGAADPTFPDVLGWAAAGVFAVVAVGFGVYAWKCYRTDLKNAVLTPEEEEALYGKQDE